MNAVESKDFVANLSKPELCHSGALDWELQVMLVIPCIGMVRLSLILGELTTKEEQDVAKDLLSRFDADQQSTGKQLRVIFQSDVYTGAQVASLRKHSTAITEMEVVTTTAAGNVDVSSLVKALRGLPNLKHLTLRGEANKTQNHVLMSALFPASAGPTTRFSVDSLRIDQPQLSRVLLQAPFFPNLQHLQVVVKSQNDLQLISNRLRVSSSILKALTLKFAGPNGAFFDFQPLARLLRFGAASRLEGLALEFVEVDNGRITSCSPEDEDDVEAIVSALQGQSILTTLSLGGLFSGLDTSDGSRLFRQFTQSINPRTESLYLQDAAANTVEGSFLRKRIQQLRALRELKLVGPYDTVQLFAAPDQGGPPFWHTLTSLAIAWVTQQDWDALTSALRTTNPENMSLKGLQVGSAQNHPEALARFCAAVIACPTIRTLTLIAPLFCAEHSCILRSRSIQILNLVGTIQDTEQFLLEMKENTVLIEFVHQNEDPSFMELVKCYASRNIVVMEMATGLAHNSNERTVSAVPTFFLPCQRATIFFHVLIDNPQLMMHVNVAALADN